MSKQFRPTLWPGEVIAPPRVIPAQSVEIVDSEWVTWELGPPQDAGYLPNEFYLREMKLFDFFSCDIEDVAVLVESYGVPFLHDYKEWSGEYYGWEAREVAAELRRQYRGEAELAVVNPGQSLHISEAQAHFDSLRFLREAWVECQSSGTMAGLAERFRVSEKQTRRDFLATLNKGLGLAHARAIDPDAPEELATIYGVCCLQLYNHIAEEAQFKRCSNESCRQWFVRQRGRSARGQHKKDGIKFCSRSCARAQAQRELRRRKTHGDRAEAIGFLRMKVLEAQERRFLATSTNQEFPEIGAKLRRARENAGLSQQEMARQLNTSTQWIEALDAGTFSLINNGAEFWVRGELRQYAEALSLDVDDVMGLYEAMRLPEVSGPAPKGA